MKMRLRAKTDLEKTAELSGSYPVTAVATAADGVEVTFSEAPTPIQLGRIAGYLSSDMAKIWEEIQ